VSGTRGRAGLVATLMPAASDALDGCPAADHAPATSTDMERTWSGPCSSRRDMTTHAARSRTPARNPLLPRATAAARPGEHGRCPVGMATPAAPRGTGADVPQTVPDTSAATVRHAVQVPDTRGHAAASDVSRWCGG
jgi:hypothetical protein